MTKYFILTLLFLFSIDTFNAKVIGISDGDTIVVLTEDKQQLKIRLEGIDCPESNQEYGEIAKQATVEICFGKEARIEKTGLDQYGRTLAYVFVEEICVNKELLRRGMAWHFKRYNKDEALSQIENEAKEMKIGLWSQDNPQAPWDFRHKN